MNNSILNRAPKVPSIFISPRFFLALFLCLNLNISKITAQNLFKKLAKGESLNLEISKEEFEKLELFVATSKDGKLVFNVDGIEIELKSFEKFNTGSFQFTIPGDKFKINENCNLKIDLNVIAGTANVDSGIINCKFRF